MENKDNCKHEWKEIERGKRVAGFEQPGLLTDGMVWYEMRILQRCEKCGLNNVVIF